LFCKVHVKIDHFYDGVFTSRGQLIWEYPDVNKRREVCRLENYIFPLCRKKMGRTFSRLTSYAWI